MKHHRACFFRVGAMGFYPPVLIGIVLAACVGSLTGCGASLPNELAVDQGKHELNRQKVGTDFAVSSTPVRLPPEAEKFASMTVPGNTAYKIGPQDVLDVTVFKVPELSRSVQVADTGSINLPLVGDVPVAGKTAQEVERSLVADLGKKYLQSPQVTVYVKEYNSQRVTVEGAVRKPGVYPIRSKTSLLQAMAFAGGLDENTADLNVAVFRRVEGKRFAAKFNIDEIRSGRTEDPVLREGDVVVVSTSEFKAAFNNIFKVLPVATLFVPLL